MCCSFLQDGWPDRHPLVHTLAGLGLGSKRSKDNVVTEILKTRPGAHCSCERLAAPCSGWGLRGPPWGSRTSGRTQLSCWASLPTALPPPLTELGTEQGDEAHTTPPPAPMPQHPVRPRGEAPESGHSQDTSGGIPEEQNILDDRGAMGVGGQVGALHTEGKTHKGTQTSKLREVQRKRFKPG